MPACFEPLVCRVRGVDAKEPIWVSHETIDAGTFAAGSAAPRLPRPHRREPTLGDGGARRVTRQLPVNPCEHARSSRR